MEWDCRYKAEPFYKAFRDADPGELCAQAGFSPEDYIQFVVPSLGVYGEPAILDAVAPDAMPTVDSQPTGRLADGVCWFGFGAWRR